VNKQTVNIVAIAVLVLGVITFIMQFVFSSGGHVTLTQAAATGWWLLLVIGLARLSWNWRRSRKS
jgi:hypothetical protein